MYTHSRVGPDGLVEDHFQARPTMSSEECQRQGPMNIDGTQRFAQPVHHRFEPELDFKPDQTVRTSSSSFGK